MATAYASRNSFGLFGDEVFSAGDLNRRSSEILNRARENPVTINRNSEQFALLRRDQAARLVRSSDHFWKTIELIAAAILVVEKKEPPASMSWLRAFDVDDLRKMIQEVLAESAFALRESGDWEAVDAVIHQWHESGLVAMSGVLKEAMESTPEESELASPESILSAESEIAPSSLGH